MKSNSIYTIRLAILLTCLVFTTTIFADVKIKTRMTAHGQSSEYTTFIKGKRERTEQGIGDQQIINITQCDLRRGLQLMPQAKIYTIDNWQQAETKPTDSAPGKTTEITKGGVVTSTITTKDTGERKQMFGYTARHLIITMETKSSPDACTKNDSRMVFDGWYIDAAFAFDCLNDRYKNYNPAQGKSGCQDRYETKQVGTAKRGYAVYEKMSMFDQSGREITSSVNEVLEISNQTLDAGLFEAPADYRVVKDRAELYASLSNEDNGGASSRNSSSYDSNGSSVSSRNSSTSGNSDLASSVKDMAARTGENSAPEVGAKKSGILRVGLANVKTDAVGEGMNASELAGAVQNTLSEYLKSPNVEVVRLEAKLPSAIESEAKSKECDFVIYATVSHKKGGGGFGMFGKALGSVVAQTGGGAWGNTAANVAGAVAVNTISAATVSQNIKSKDEITLDIKLVKNGAQAFAKQYKQKAKGNGDDIITPLVEQAAQAILDAAK